MNLTLKLFFANSFVRIFFIITGLSFLMLYVGAALWFGTWRVSEFDGFTFIWLIFLAIFLIIPVGVVLYFSWAKKYRRHLILKHGVKTQAKVVEQKPYALLSEGGERHVSRFLFKHQQGELKEQNFMQNVLPTEMEQKNHNKSYASVSRTHPQESFLRYPKQEEGFEIIYIPKHEENFLILNEGESEFARNIRAECQVQDKLKQEEQQQVQLIQEKARNDLMNSK